MKIAVAVIDKNENSEISSRGGRAPYYLIFDENKKFLKAVQNPFTMGGGGAGIAVAKMLADMDVNVFIANTIGEKMCAALNEKGVKFYEKTGIAKEIIGDL